MFGVGRGVDGSIIDLMWEELTEEISTVGEDCQIFKAEEIMKDWKGVAQQQAHNNLD
eukprot:jgi/Psemu1/314949/fgenesh1_kg.1790_\